MYNQADTVAHYTSKPGYVEVASSKRHFRCIEKQNVGARSLYVWVADECGPRGYVQVRVAHSPEFKHSRAIAHPNDFANNHPIMNAARGM